MEVLNKVKNPLSATAKYLTSANKSLPLIENWTQSQVTSHPTQYTQQLAGVQLKLLLCFPPSNGRDELGTVREVINN